MSFDRQINANGETQADRITEDIGRIADALDRIVPDFDRVRGASRVAMRNMVKDMRGKALDAGAIEADAWLAKLLDMIDDV